MPRFTALHRQLSHEEIARRKLEATKEIVIALELMDKGFESSGAVEDVRSDVNSVLENPLDFDYINSSFREIMSPDDPRVLFTCQCGACEDENCEAPSNWEGYKPKPGQPLSSVALPDCRVKHTAFLNDSNKNMERYGLQLQRCCGSTITEFVDILTLRVKRGVYQQLERFFKHYLKRYVEGKVTRLPNLTKARGPKGNMLKMLNNLREKHPEALTHIV